MGFHVSLGECIIPTGVTLLMTLVTIHVTNASYEVKPLILITAVASVECSTHFLRSAIQHITPIFYPDINAVYPDIL